MQRSYITAQHSVLTLREKWDLRTTVWLAGRGVAASWVAWTASGEELWSGAVTSVAIAHDVPPRDMWASWRARCAAKLRIVAASMPHTPPEIKTAICFKVRKMAFDIATRP